MATQRNPNIAPMTDAWGVTKTMKPDQRGAIKLSKVYGNQLLCVRCRENSTCDERMTTVELIVERVPIQKRVDEILSFKIKPEEGELREAARAKGARFDGKNKMWQLERTKVLQNGPSQQNRSDAGSASSGTSQ